MKKNIICLGLCILAALLSSSCSGDKQPQKSSSASAQNVSNDTVKTQPPLAKSDSYYVLDRRQNTIFEINLNTDSITQRFVLEDDVVAIAYDMQKELVFEAVGKPNPGLKIFDPKTSKVIQSLDFPQPPSDILFNPIKRELYLVSQDSSYFRIFLPDSMKTKYHYPLTINEARPVGPRAMSPGPSGTIYTANGARSSVSVLTTSGNYAYQTITINGAKFIDNAVSSFDGNSSYCCDSKQGKLFRVEFGTGKTLTQKGGLDNPRLIQFEVNSLTVAVVVGKTKVLMLNPDSFAETGQIDLSDYGDEILSLYIPPRANYAELTMDYKGVTRWLRLDLRTWKPTRMVELY
jgi:DNA-binding beta-propeller fold protein YncE